MNNHRLIKAGSYGAIFACLGLLSGCLIVDDDDPDVGTLTVEWTIDGLRDPADCVGFDVDRLELSLYVGGDQLIDEVEPPCEAFGVTIDLVEGRYSADATLIDRFGGTASTTETLQAVDIVAGTDLVINVDFPIDSIL